MSAIEIHSLFFHVHLLGQATLSLMKCRKTCMQMGYEILISLNDRISKTYFSRAWSDMYDSLRFPRIEQRLYLVYLEKPNVNVKKLHQARQHT